MIIRSVSRSLLLIVLAGLAACSSLETARHEYLMRGQVVSVSGSDAVVCIGSSDGARAGQTLNAYKMVEKKSGGSAKTPPRWERVKVGTVSVLEVLDEHFARARVDSGEVKVNDLVELAAK